MEIEELIKEIVPPADWQHRNGFSNEIIIAKLNAEERISVEEKLLKMAIGSYDEMVIEGLVYLKSEKAVPILTALLNGWKSNLTKLFIASCIYNINNDYTMIEKAIKYFTRMEIFRFYFKTFALIEAFYYLRQFTAKRTNALIEKYINHPCFLVSSNAKDALGIKDLNVS
jgi:hypothetical protein